MSPKGDRVPQRGPKSHQRGKFVRHGHRIYHTATKIYPNMSVHSITYAAQYVPQLGLLAPFWGHKPPYIGETFGHLRRALFPSSFDILVLFLIALVVPRPLDCNSPTEPNYFGKIGRRCYSLL